MISTRENKIANSWTNQEEDKRTAGEEEGNGKGDESHRPQALDRK